MLEAYDNHHLGAPKLKRVRFDLQGGSALVRYEDGDIDVTGVGLDDLERVQERDQLARTCLPGQFATVHFASA